MYHLRKIELLPDGKFDIRYRERVMKCGSSGLRHWIEHWWVDEQGNLRVKVAKDVESLGKGSISSPLVIDFEMGPPLKPKEQRKITCKILVEETSKLFEKELPIEKHPQ